MDTEKTAPPVKVVNLEHAPRVIPDKVLIQRLSDQINQDKRRVSLLEASRVKVPPEVAIPPLKRTTEEQKAVDTFEEAIRQQNERSQFLAKSQDSGRWLSKEQILEIDAKAAAERRESPSCFSCNPEIQTVICNLLNEVKGAVAGIDDKVVANAIFMNSLGQFFEDVASGFKSLDKIDLCVLSSVRQHVTDVVRKACGISPPCLGDENDFDLIPHSSWKSINFIPDNYQFNIDYEKLEKEIHIGYRHAAVCYVNAYPLLSLWTLIKWPIWRLRKRFPFKVSRVLPAQRVSAEWME